MGSLCGWSGTGPRAEASSHIIDAMLGGYGRAAEAVPESTSSDTRSLAVSPGLYATSFCVQEGIAAALIGTPEWEEQDLADTVRVQGLAASLIKAYQKYGKDLLTRLHGAFALAIVEDESALVAIDRIGIHTLSYAQRDGLLVFSTTAGSVARHPEISRAIDPQAIFNYFYFYDIPSPGSIYQGVEKLLPAQYVRFHNGKIEKDFYWRLHYKDDGQASFEQEKARFFDLMRSAVRSNTQDSSTAAFLSGGTDSSTVTGILSEIISEPVNTYSIGFGAEGFDEMEYARLAASRFGASPNEYYLKPDDILEAIPLIARSYDEPFANESAVPTYFCARQAARDGVKVMLAGDGGDEIFGGNARYAKQMVFEHYARLPAFMRSYLIEPLAFGFPGGDRLLPIRKLQSYIRQAKIPLPERMESYNFIQRHPLEEIFSREFLVSINPRMPEAMLHDAYFRADSGHPVHRMLHLDMKFTLADNDLRKVSRMCEVAGVEVRYPLLDERMVEFSASLPTGFKIRGQKLRWLFKVALKDFLPKLRALVDEKLARFEQRGYVRPDYIRTLRHQHAEEHPTYSGKMIWVMLMLEQWLEIHIDNP